MAALMPADPLAPMASPYWQNIAFLGKPAPRYTASTHQIHSSANNMETCKKPV
jgi:hypothetical protein